MNIPLLKEWVAALRSGEYKQAYGLLRSYNPSEPNSFCCLGVASDLCAKRGIGKWEREKFVAERSSSQVDLVPEVTEALFGVTGTYSVVPLSIRNRGNIRVSLTAANDSGCTFDQIADLIEYFFIKPYEGASDGQS